MERVIKNYEDMERIGIVDAHSHFGKDNFWPNYGNYFEYCDYSRFINEVFAMSVPCPVFCKDDGTETILSYYRMEGKEIKHYQVKQKDGISIYTPNLLGMNPYKEANDYIYNLCKNDNEIKFNYVPIIHPYYYSYDDLIEHKKRGAKMFKIHGVACGVIPQKINPEFFKILEYLKIPIIIHSDFSREENILFYNNAINWLECLKEYDIKVFFAHAVRLSEYAIDIINKDSRYIIGIGPDKVLNIDGQNDHNIRDYLKYCFFRFKMDKIVFDIDYPWNIQNVNDFNYDWNSLDRIENLGLTFDEKEKVLSKNIKKFIGERNVRFL